MLGVEGAGSGECWECRVLGVEGAGNGGCWEWKMLGVEGAGSGGCWERSRESRTACSPVSTALCSGALGWDRLRSGGRYVLCITAVSRTDLLKTFQLQLLIKLFRESET